MYAQDDIIANMPLFKHRFKYIAKGLANNIAATIGPHKWPSSSPKLWVMMYHRILPLDDPRHITEEPGMIVTPEDFEMHVKTLKKHFNITTLNEWADKKSISGALPSKNCVITFDDGWLDNYQYAWPILKKHNIPATIYLATNLIGKNTRFWPNRLIALYRYFYQDKTTPIAPNEFLSLFSRPDSNTLTPEFLTHAIWAAKQLPESDVVLTIDSIESAIPHHLLSTDSELMNWEHIRELNRSDLISIGSHTKNHIKLDNTCNNEKIFSEIKDSKEDITLHTNHCPSLFSYPYGAYNSYATETARSNYLCATTTSSGINSPYTDLMELKRIRVHSDISNTPTQLLARMSGWF